MSSILAQVVGAGRRRSIEGKKSDFNPAKLAIDRLNLLPEGTTLVGVPRPENDDGPVRQQQQLLPPW